MTIEALEGVSDQELFDDANADEVTETTETPEPEAKEQQPETPAAATAETETKAATDQQARTPVDDNAAQVPSWRVREINDEKRVLAEKVAALEAERLNWQRQPQPAAQPAPQVAAPPARPDPLLDPEGYAAAVREEVRQEMLNERREASLANAHKTYKTEFEEAYAAAQKAVDPALKARMQQSRDPGETLIAWHREQKTRAEVGDDPNAYFQKKLDAWLADPANQAKVIERARGTATQQPGQTRQAAPAVSLPPSLTRATNASSDVSADDNDISDDGLWRHANA